jgi:hypothetical protein
MRQKSGCALSEKEYLFRPHLFTFAGRKTVAAGKLTNNAVKSG